MNITHLRPCLLLQGDLYWLAWDFFGQPVFSMPVATEYLRVQGMLENLGFHDVFENSAIASHIRDEIEKRQQNW